MRDVLIGEIIQYTVGASCVRPRETAGLPYGYKMIRRKQISNPGRFLSLSGYRHLCKL